MRWRSFPTSTRNRMGAMGWSYGGYMMMWFEGHTERFKAIASMMGMYDLQIISRRDRRDLVSRMGSERSAVELVALREVVAFKLGEEFQNPRAGDIRRARLPRAVHAVAAVFHCASEDECAVQADHLLERRSLAELV